MAASVTVRIGAARYRLMAVGRYLGEGLVDCRLQDVQSGTRAVRRPVEETVVEAAVRRPPGFFRWNVALRGAFNKGVAAAGDGATPQDCPYADKRKASGGLTWSRAYARAWEDGLAWGRRLQAQVAAIASGGVEEREEG